MNKNSVILLVSLFGLLALIGSAAATLSSISQTYPPNATYVNTTTPTFTFVPFGNFTSNCTLIVNATAVGTGFNLTNNTAANITSTLLLQGLHTWYVNCTNNGTTLISNTSIFTVDSIPPDLLIVSPHTNDYLSSHTLIINLTVNESNINYTIIGVVNSSGIVVSSTNNSNASNYVVVESVSSDGTYNISATSYDYAGLSSSNVVVSNLTIDTMLPTASLGSGSTQSGNNVSTSIVVNASGSDAHLANVTIYLYNSTGGVYASNTTAAGTIHTFIVVDGNYSYNATAFDLAGNHQNTSTVTNIVIDTTAPIISLSGLINNSAVSSVDVTFNSTATDALVGMANCWIVYENGTTTNTSNTLCSNVPISLINLSETTHNITFYATDTLGNLRGATYNFTVDVSPPSVVINSPQSSSLVASQTMNVNLTVVEPNILYTNISIFNTTGGIVNSTTSASTGNYVVSFYSLADSTYNITAITFDNAGHNTSTSVSNVVVDSTNPTITYGGGNTTPGYTTSNSINVNVSAGDAHLANFSIYLYDYGSLYENFTNTTTANFTGFFYNFSNLPDGNYSYNATAYDAAGNHVSTSTVKNIVIDTIAPTILVNSPASNTFVSSMAINLTVTDANTNYTNVTVINVSGVIVNSTKLSSSGNVVLAWTVPEGVYNITVATYDFTGHSNSTIVSNVTIDSTAPTISFGSGSNMTVGNHNSTIDITVNINASDAHLANVTINLYNSGVLYLSVNNTVAFNYTFTNLTDGNYSYNATVLDAAGNHQNTSTVKNIVIDTTAPTIATNAVSYYNTSNVSITFNITDATIGMSACYVVNESGSNTTAKNNTNCNILVSLTNLSEGTHNVTIVANDTLNNAVTKTYTFTVDIIPPTVASGPSASSITATSASVSLITDEPTTKTIDYGIASTSEFNQSDSTAADSKTFSLTGLSASTTYNYTITYCDLAGNCGTTAETSFVTSSASSGGGGGGSNNNGGGGGGGGSVDLSSSELTDTESLIFGDLPSGTKDIAVDNMLLTDIILTTAGDSTDVHFSISTTLMTSDPIKVADKLLYTYIVIDHQNLADVNISSAKIRFKVGKDWLLNNSIDKSSILLYRYSSGWNELVTRVLSDDTSYVYYEADSPGLSTFAIAGSTQASIIPIVTENQTPPVTTPTNTEVTPPVVENNTTTPAAPKAGSSYLWIIIVAVAIVVILIILATTAGKKKK